MQYKDLVFGTVDGKDLLLDLYLPEKVASPTLIVWVHGGAWRAGTKDNPPMSFVRAGFALASVQYRLSVEARFPAQIHDIKAAIRFLRAMAGKYGYSAEKIGIAGSSAGGHLVALVGTTNSDKQLEGNIGDHLGQSSSVQAIVDYFGPTNFMTILNQSTPHGLSVRVPALELLLGDRPEKIPDLARLASPVFHVDASDPPLLILHGDQDPQVPINQSHELEGAYKKLHLDVYLDVVHGAAHGGDMFHDKEHDERTMAFLRRTLNPGTQMKSPHQ